jgi:hypothetical protein
MPTTPNTNPMSPRLTPSSVVITGAEIIEGSIVKPVRSAHAPTAVPVVSSVPSGLDLTNLDDDDLDDLIAPRSRNQNANAEAVWQEVVRMLVAREAAKAMHPSARRTSAA